MSTVPPNSPIDPLEPGRPRRFYRRYWDTYNRPYPGCGCLWVIIIIAFLIWIFSWAGGYHWWGGNPAPGPGTTTTAPR